MVLWLRVHVFVLLTLRKIPPFLVYEPLNLFLFLFYIYFLENIILQVESNLCLLAFNFQFIYFEPLRKICKEKYAFVL